MPTTLHGMSVQGRETEKHSTHTGSTPELGAPLFCQQFDEM